MFKPVLSDWYPDQSDVFIASAIANVSIAGLEAARDLAEGGWEGATNRPHQA